ncbi:MULTISPECIES: HesA/MoeB/ThiF family protein [Kocuria]|uniref:ThiF family adenylyltransferase n=1 Tax=Kocuria subflava TaxID=1736139 RepID=A0A846UB07_9MICC|nr:MULTISPECIES: ThiF family adenylyltransferase [Kocuria]NKE10696.1 ThiF family adenylyltransferase [Kocuria subflava]
MIDLDHVEERVSIDLDPLAEARYAEFSLRNRPLIDSQWQQKFREAVILVAGCGSTGGAAVEPLVRLGAENLRLCEPGTFELNNLNRQSATTSDLDQNKAVVLQERAERINPAVHCEVNTEGITSQNAHALVRGAAVVVDGVDVTTMNGWRAKYFLHEAASRAGIPVVVGYDMSGVQYIRTYRYRAGDRPFDGAINLSDLRSETHWRLLHKVVPVRKVPIDLLQGLSTMKGDEGFPQLVYTALMFGAAASRIALCLVAGHPVAKEVVLDLHSEVLPAPARLRARITAPLRRAMLLDRVLPQLVPQRK